MLHIALYYITEQLLRQFNFIKLIISSVFNRVVFYLCLHSLMGISEQLIWQSRRNYLSD